MFAPPRTAALAAKQKSTVTSAAHAENLDRSSTKRRFKILTNSLTPTLDKSPSFDSNQK
jgi:hypothetical protein